MENNGPTTFDINRPRTYGPNPSARPVITGHRPIMPDPMVSPRPAAKIHVDTDDDPKPADNHDKLDQDKLADAMFPVKTEAKPAESFSGPAIMPDEMPKRHEPVRVPRESHNRMSDISGMNMPDSMSAKDVDNELPPKFMPDEFETHSDKPKNKPLKTGSSGSKMWLILTGILVVLAGLYAAIDKGIILDSLNLPVHIFSQKTEDTTTTPPPAAPVADALPAGFSTSKLLEANLSFIYPTAWGTTSASVDQGFTKRNTKDTKAKPDTPYAYIVTFANNKDVQFAVTSAKVLPPARTLQYYDLLGWCIGTVDQNYYAGALKFTTANNVDTPGTVACDQGPLAGVSKIDKDTIVQTGIKNADGSAFGDLYTKNLTDKTFPVVRVRDVTAKNATQIKTMLTDFKSISQ